jgi:hypothetical protein
MRPEPFDRLGTAPVEGRDLAPRQAQRACEENRQSDIQEEVAAGSAASA